MNAKDFSSQQLSSHAPLFSFWRWGLMDFNTNNTLHWECSSILCHKEYYFSASQFSLLVPNWTHKSRPLRVRNVAVSPSVIFTLIYQFIKIHWCRIGERKWQHKSGLQHNDPNQLGIAENVMMNYVLVLVPLYIVIVLLYEWDASLPTWAVFNGKRVERIPLKGRNACKVFWCFAPSPFIFPVTA